MRSDKAVVLGSTTRLKLLACLKDRPRNVNQLIKICGLTQSAVSQHLAKLRKFGLVSCRRRGRESYYQLSQKSLGVLAQQLLTYLKNL